MNPATDLFLQRYQNLNPEQRAAVDTVYGPVMVIAGPGTGKTEVLSLRIAALLRSEAQVAPHEILCLTYTDEAANSMRKRLVSVIGPEAHKVSLCTFHAFCNTIIQQNAEYFPQRSLSVVSDLEKADLMRGLIDALPEGHPLRRYGASPYFDIPRLGSLFEFMKREAVPVAHIEDAAAAYLADLPHREEYRYKRKSGPHAAGDLKQAKIDEEARRMGELVAAARLYDDYTARLDAIGRYDYADMILWVLRAFDEHPALLMRCQERYQFILVDEFQDTNGAQLAVVNALTDQGHDDAPNVFVVGDDDQSIYEFQGARIRNILDFYERYRRDVNVVVLPRNYRSSQAVLDRAGATIRNNRERLINRLEHLNLTKDIVASHPRFRDGGDTVPPEVLEFSNPVQEETWVVSEIERLQEAGVNLNEVAVLYAQHKQAAGVIRQLERKGIPFCAKQPANVLDLPLVRTVISVLRYLHAERTKAFSGEYLLFDWMHAPVFGIDPTDIATMALFARVEGSKAGRTPPPYRALLDNPLLLQTLDLRSPEAVLRLGTLLNRWLQQQATLPLTLLLETILHESGLIARVLEGPEPVWDMQALRTFFDFVKETCTAAPRTGIPELLVVLDRMDEEKIALKFEKVFQSERGVNFYTAHGSKGNEFEYVFLLGCNKQFWEKKTSRAGFKLPDTLTNTADDAPQSNDEEVARRLFYVALTRAKKHLAVSYSTESNDGRKWDNSLFVDEISAPEERLRPRFDNGPLLRHLEWAMQPVPPVQIRLGQRQWVERTLQNMALSPSTLSNFLRCPVSFYYECILRVPQQDAPYFAFGSAVHYALEVAFLDMRRTGSWPEKEAILKAFDKAMFSEREAMAPEEYRRRVEYGHTLLSEYYDERLQTLYRDVEIEYKVPRLVLDGAVPITGRIDKIERYPDGVVVVDYKTGKAANAAKKINPPSEDTPLGGDYWRQMVFYKILLEAQPDRRWEVKYGFFDLLEKGDRGHYEPKTVPMYDADVATVKAQIKDAWGRIQNGDFDTGCGEETCAWCGFARRHELVRPVEDGIILD